MTEAERYAQLAERLSEKCARCGADLKGTDDTAWHAGYRFALAEIACMMLLISGLFFRWPSAKRRIDSTK